MNMFDIFQHYTQFLVLLVMSCSSLVLSLSFYLKSRILRKVSKNARANVYDKIFNVVSPYPKHRKIINNVIPAVLFAVVFVFSSGFAFMKVLEIGLVLSLVLFIVCLGLMMFDDALEIFENTNIFIKAFRNRVNLGEGDLAALLFLKETLPKLSIYYVLLAIVLFTSFVASPYIAHTALLIIALFLGMTIEFTTSFSGVVGAFAGPLAVAAVAMLFLVGGGIVKNKVFGFPPSIPTTALEEQFEHVHVMCSGDCPPFELSHRPMVEDPEVEERKRRSLMRSR